MRTVYLNHCGFPNGIKRGRENKRYFHRPFFLWQVQIIELHSRPAATETRRTRTFSYPYQLRRATQRNPTAWPLFGRRSATCARRPTQLKPRAFGWSLIQSSSKLASLLGACFLLARGSHPPHALPLRVVSKGDTLNGWVHSLLVHGSSLPG